MSSHVVIMEVSLVICSEIQYDFLLVERTSVGLAYRHKVPSTRWLIWSAPILQETQPKLRSWPPSWCLTLYWALMGLANRLHLIFWLQLTRSGSVVCYLEKNSEATSRLRVNEFMVDMNLLS